LSATELASEGLQYVWSYPPSESTDLRKYTVLPNAVELHYPDADYPDRLVPSGKSVENSTKLTGLEIACYRIKYSAVLVLELQIRRGRNV